MQIIDMQEKQDLLVFRYDEQEQLAIPLSLVFKVEQIEVSQIQTYRTTTSSTWRAERHAPLPGQVSSDQAAPKGP